MAPESKIKLIRSVWNLLPGVGTGGAAKSSAAEDILKHIGKDASFIDYLKSGGAEEFLKKFPNFKPAKQSAFMQWVDSAVVPKTKGPIVQGIKGAAQRGAGVDTRQRMQGIGSPGTPVEGQE